MSWHLICPHCHQHVRGGVHASRECQAEIGYGTPPSQILPVLVPAMFAGIEVTGLTAVLWPGFPAAALIVAGLCVWFARLFRNRVVFNRVYRCLGNAAGGEHVAAPRIA
jgi:hypothetical protein